MTPARISKSTLLIGLCAVHINAPALQSDLSKPYLFHSNTVMYQRNRHETIYQGQVTAKQGSTTISGDTILVFNSSIDASIKEIIAHGKQAHYSTKPNPSSEKLHAQANTIKYWPKDGKVLLIKAAKINQHHNIFTGGLIWYDINKQTVLSGSNTASHTRIVIQPHKKA